MTKEPIEGDPARFDAVLAMTTSEQWAELAAALDAVVDAGPPYAEWTPLKRSESGVITPRYPVYPPVVRRLWDAAGEFIVVFRWPEWTGYSAYDDPAALADAPVHDALRMITRTVRGERFSDGHILGELDAGRFQAAVRRLLDARPTRG